MSARSRPKRGAKPRRPAAAAEPKPIPAEFEKSAATLAQAPAEGGREVAFAGRSNAGKSSCLNRLTGRRSLARTSKTPGRTQLLNFFQVSEGGHADRRFVDLPGYGYAKTDRSTREAWQHHVEGYLAGRQSLVGLVLLMDVRHPFQPFDEQLLGWAGSAALPTLVLLNKADKLSRGAAGGVLQQARHRLAEQPNITVLLFSALKGTGSEQVLTILRDWLQLDLPPAEPPLSPPDL